MTTKQLFRIARVYASLGDAIGGQLDRFIEGVFDGVFEPDGWADEETREDAMPTAGAMGYIEERLLPLLEEVLEDGENAVDGLGELVLALRGAGRCPEHGPQVAEDGLCPRANCGRFLNA